MASPLNFGQIRALHDRRDIDAAHLFNHQAIKIATFAPLGGCGEPEVSEFAPQVAQELCGVGDCFDWIKGVGKTARVRGRWHEPRHALRACAAYCRRIEAALLPNQPGEEIDRQIIFCPCRHDRITDARDIGLDAQASDTPQASGVLAL